MLSPTTLVDITYAAGAFLAVLGVIVSIWPPRNGWWKTAAVSVFVILACVGGICVHLTQVTAESERGKDQAQARSDRRVLLDKIESLSKTQDVSLKTQTASASDITQVKRQTAPLMTSPLPVEIKNPKILKAEETIPRIWWSQKPLPPSSDGTEGYGIEVSLRSDKELPGASFRWRCSAPITAGNAAGGAMYWSDRRGSDWLFRSMMPALSPSTPWTLTLRSDKPIRVVECIWLGSSPQPAIVEQ
jgi:hypothetical protein